MSNRKCLVSNTNRLVSERPGARMICTVVYPDDMDLVDDGISVLELLGAASLHVNWMIS